VTETVPATRVDVADTVAAPTGKRELYQAQVRWSDPDQMGHINHARYLSYFEDARMQLLAASPSGLAGATGDRGDERAFWQTRLLR
jgi:acyl-CoA thioesterase FadM